MAEPRVVLWDQRTCPQAAHRRVERRRGHAPAYPAEAVRTFCDGLDALVTVQPVAGVDHPGSIMSPPGAGAAAGLVLEALS